MAVSAAHRPPGGFSRRDTLAFAITAALAVVALVLHGLDASPTAVFVAAGIAVAALAYVLGEATEQAGEASSARLAALLNATFGNAPELIIVILTVNAGLIDVAKASIIGSVLGNILLILGLSLLAGGLRHGHLTFDRRPAGVNSSMLTLAVVLVALPTLFAQLGQTSTSDERVVSYGAAILMLIVYVAYLFHTLRVPVTRREDGARSLVEARVADRARRDRRRDRRALGGPRQRDRADDRGDGSQRDLRRSDHRSRPRQHRRAPVRRAHRLAREPRLRDGHRLQLRPPGGALHHRRRRAGGPGGRATTS